jgi:hypothetical protein
MEVEKYQAALDRAWDGMAAIAHQLGPDRVNAKAPVPGANSAFALVTHCLGVCEYWLGGLVAGRAIVRDRPAEFVATGTLQDLDAVLTRGRDQIRKDLAAYRPGAPTAAPADPRFFGPDDADLGQDGVLLHVLEELAQHHGQLEVLRDVLMAQR